MFELVVMPLIELWMEDGLSEEDVKSALDNMQQALSAEVGQTIRWDEQLEEVSFEADCVDPYCIFALRAVAAYLEKHDSLEGFELGEEPWNHEAFAALESQGQAEAFKQVLHADGTACVAYVPAEMPDVYLMDDEDEDEGETSFSVGSLPALRKELDRLRDALGLEADLESHIDDVVFDPAEDPLAAPRYGWLVLSARCNEAIERKLPLILMEPSEDDELFEDDDYEEGDEDYEDDDGDYEDDEKSQD